ncbi:HAD family hydrolase [Enterococcus dongliensis]|uniref:HAD family hydrolase n=1 Tax=Enterococcus dongliensis TaxID=2559925 RepID=UPI00288E30AB|nr:HAD family hydrolase [Enterococcus dongliensis]MDT2639256.1 HAD family hydrolase [Enterococcus dongliensis]
MIQGVVFDLDDTLYEQQAPFTAAITTLFPSFPQEKLKELFISFRYYSDLHYTKSITGEWSLAKMRYERIRLALADFDFLPAVSELNTFQTAYDHALQSITLPAEIVTSLKFLKQKGKLGIITNGPVNRQTDKINALGLTDWIEQENIIISDGVQIQKPDPAIFHLMENKLYLTADSLLYVGDSFDNDVQGAKAAGWSVWWFNHQKRARSTAQTAIYDEEITSFEDLGKALTNEKSLQR